MINHNEKNIKKKNVYICKLNHFAEQQKLIPHCKSTNTSIKKKRKRDFPGGAVVKNPPANAGDMSSSPAPGKYHMPWSG